MDLSKAIRIARIAHHNQTDKGGMPYILHPVYVMEAVDTEEERIVAILHDVVEDSSISFNDLQQEGFSKNVMDALKAITRKEKESYFKYIDRVKKNELATKIKIKDLEHNSDLNRLKFTLKHNLQIDIDRQDKYKKAIKMLREYKN